jgi:SNF2 family DNA or RNA helicase
MIRVIRIGSGPHYAIQCSSFSPVVRDEAKATPGMSWEPVSKVWVGYMDAVATVVDQATKRGIRIDTSALEAKPFVVVPTAYAKLRQYQNEGVHFLLAKSTEGCLLADDVGCGKSATFLTAARAIRQKTVIVCPSFVRGVWLEPKEGEIAKWWPAAKAHGLKGTKPSPIDPSFDVVVCHYDILYAWVDALITWGAKTLGIDEGHFLMGGKSRRTAATAKLAEICTHRIMLTATPMTSRPIDMWSPINVISPGRFGKFFSFGLRYADARQEQVTPTKVVWKFNGASHLDELQSRLKFFMLRRLKSELSLQLPERTRQFIELEVPRGKVMAPSSAIRSDRILRQALNMAADGKFPAVVEIVANHLHAGSKVVVGTYRKEVATLIAESVAQLHPWHVQVITGEMPQAKRAAAIAAKPDLLCVTIDSTKAGINLSYWNVGVVAELMWVPADLIQWEGRFGRQPGRNVLIQYTIGRGTCDDLIKRTVLQKLTRYAEGIGRSDDKLREDLKDLQKEGAASRLQKLYEKLRSLDD